jgi:ribosome biogenesis GTPase / thiamine phosphate phosphatase
VLEPPQGVRLSEGEDKLGLLGFGEPFAAAWERVLATQRRPGELAVARVAAQHKGGLILYTAREDLLASIPGKLRKAMKAGTADEPAVGDWVVVAPRWSEGTASVQSVLPRRTVLTRRAAGERTHAQVIASNLDEVFIVTALQHDWNPRRLERYLAIVREGGATPVVVLTKADLCTDIETARAEARAVALDAPIYVVSAHTGSGLAELDQRLLPRHTVALVGSSGVGKTTLLNRWLGSGELAVQSVLEDGRGRHTTTHRELTRLPGGALIVDTPGMRELGLWGAESGVRESFTDIDELGAYCRFADCLHEGEPGCAVSDAVERGHVTPERFASYRKLQSELRAVQRARDPAERERQKREEKALAKAVKRETKRRER